MAGQRISPETHAHITAVWPAILEGLASGKLVRDILRDAGITSDMKRAYILTEPSAAKEWDEAREASADAFLDEAMDVARNTVDVIPQGEGKEPLIVRIDPAHARNRIDTLKWAARIRNPRLYGDKAQLDVNVRTVDLTAIILAANARLAASRAPLAIEHDADSTLALPCVPDALRAVW
jgi:hypothetical protein